MTEQPAAPAKQQAAPAPDQPLSAQEEAYLGKLLARQAAAAAQEGSVRMKVEGDHESISYGGLTVGAEFTPVPAQLVAPLIEAATDAGVTITQES